MSGSLPFSSLGALLHPESCLFCIVQVIEAKTPQAVLGVEGEDARIDSKYVPILAPFLSCPDCMQRVPSSR